MVVIGLDTHIATCDFFAVNGEGQPIGQGTFATSRPGFVDMVKPFKGQEVVLVIEQGPLTDWIIRITKLMVPKVVAAETRRNRWISQDSTKNDRFDAEKLARLYLGGFVKEVIQRDEKNEEILRLVLHHHDLVSQRTQIKNKIKSKFRQCGVRASGEAVYNKNQREAWIAQISNDHLVWPTDSRFIQLDLFDSQIAKTDKLLNKTAKRYPIVGKLIDKFPGIGLINAATFVALIDTPHRFASVKKVWTYCGLGLDCRSSGLKAGKPKLTFRGNRMLKYILKQAAITAINMRDPNDYRDWYKASVAGGKPEHKAVLACSRKLTKDMWLYWKKEAESNALVKSA